MKLYESEHDKVIFYDKMSTYFLNFLGYSLWVVILFFVFFFNLCKN